MKALEEELGQLRLGQLEKRAVQEGIPVVELDDAMVGACGGRGTCVPSVEGGETGQLRRRAGNALHDLR